MPVLKSQKFNPLNQFQSFSTLNTVRTLLYNIQLGSYTKFLYPPHTDFSALLTMIRIAKFRPKIIMTFIALLDRYFFQYRNEGIFLVANDENQHLQKNIYSQLKPFPWV